MAQRTHGIMTLILLAVWGSLMSATAEEGKPLALRIDEAVLLALERNLDLTIERIEPLVAHEQIRLTAGAFDPSLKLSAVWRKVELPVNSALELGNEDGTITEEGFTPEMGVTGKLTTGTQYSFSLVAPFTETDTPNRLFGLYYRPVLLFGLTQPLLKDFGLEVNLVRFHQAAKTEQIAALGVEAKMLTVIRDVEINYWTLFFVQQHVRVAAASLELAHDLVQRLRRMLKAGLATRMDVRLAETSVEVRRSDLLRAQADLLNVQVQMRLLINPELNRDTRLLAVEGPPEEGAPTDLEGQLAQALARRPEPRQQRLAIENLKLEAVLARNNTLPRLDLIGNFGYTGLAGSRVGPRIVTVPPRLQGRSSYLQGFDDFFTTQGNATWSAGLQLEVPIGNREALGKLEQTRLRQQQGQVRQTLLTHQISLEVQTAFQDMTAEWQRLAAAGEEVKLAREQLDAEERLLTAGRTTVRKVLEAQDELAKAQDRRLQALMSYGTARSRLAAAAAASFETYKLVIAQ
jgi:outer membrane protein